MAIERHCQAKDKGFFMNTIKRSHLLIASLLILSVILNINNDILFTIHTEAFYSRLLLIILGLSFFVFNLLAALGVLFSKPWGFWLAYLAVVISTIFFSTSYIPFISHLFHENIRYLPAIIGNLIVLAFIVYQHRLLKREA